MEKRDQLMLAHLRSNGRQRLTALSRKIRMPVSTIFDRMRGYENNIIHRYTILLDAPRMGYSTKAYVLLRCAKDKKKPLMDRLMKELSVNNLFRVNNGWDVIAECIFRDMKGLEEFFESLEADFKISKKEVHYVIEDLKREAFFSDPDLVGISG